MATVRSASNMRIPRDKPPDELRVAVDAFLSRPGLSPQTRRSYRLTLAALTTALDAAGAEPAAAAIEAAARLRWGTVGPATWNRHAAAVRSFLGYAARHGLLPELRVELDRRREPADRTRALPKAALERLWNRRDVALRDKTLWRLLYETAARAGEALSLDVDDLDLPNRRAAIRGKNGELDYLHWQTGTGHLLSRLVAGRTSGPVFLTDRRPSARRAPAAVDLCPHTGRARLSYRRAQELFCEATGGWTLHQLRHSALTHLAEQNVALPLLMAKSRHTSLRSLQKYARPGVDAVAKLTADHDPARRRP
jgi:integrase/recombinase XerC/integrase/recombinase XerD